MPLTRSMEDETMKPRNAASALERALGLRVLGAFPEDPSSLSSTHVRGLTNSCNYNSRDLTPSAGFSGHSHTHLHMHTQIKIVTLIIFLKIQHQTEGNEMFTQEPSEKV